MCQLSYNAAQVAYIFSSDKCVCGHLTTGSKDEQLEIFGSWSLDEHAQSSTCRELEAIQRVSTHFSTALKVSTVRVYTAKKNVARIIRIGS